MNEQTMKECPFCKELIPEQAKKCRYCKSDLDPIPREPGYRDFPGRIIAGVATYIARALGISVSLVRVAFVIATLLAAPFAIGVYIAVWLIVPLRRGEPSPLERFVEEAKQAYRRMTDSFSSRKGRKDEGPTSTPPALPEENGNS
jgi:phage shock protein C